MHLYETSPCPGLEPYSKFKIKRLQVTRVLRRRPHGGGDLMRAVPQRRCGRARAVRGLVQVQIAPSSSSCQCPRPTVTTKSTQLVSELAARSARTRDCRARKTKSKFRLVSPSAYCIDIANRIRLMGVKLTASPQPHTANNVGDSTWAVGSKPVLGI